MGSGCELAGAGRTVRRRFDAVAMPIDERSSRRTRTPGPRFGRHGHGAAMIAESHARRLEREVAPCRHQGGHGRCRTRSTSRLERLDLPSARADRIISPSPWGYSSAGRALAWHARGQRFDPAYLHHSCIAARGSPRGCERSRSPSSRGLGHHPFTVSTGVRIPLGTPRSSNLLIWQ